MVIKTKLSYDFIQIQFCWLSFTFIKDTSIFYDKTCSRFLEDFKESSSQEEVNKRFIDILSGLKRK